MGPTISIGDIRIRPFKASRFRLDGGTMFGVVPRSLWEKKAPPDGLNRIELSVNSLLVEAGGALILVEPGMGVKFSRKEKEIYCLDEMDCAGQLRRMGVEPGEVEMVIATHLHLDHIGGATRFHGGVSVPEFSNALHVVQRTELESALEPHPLEKASYRQEDIRPLVESGLVKQVEGKVEVATGVVVEHTGGHTVGHQVVRFRSGDEEGVYVGDLIPTTAHLPLRWLMSWDMFPREVFSQRAALLGEAADKGMTVFWSHDPWVFASKVRRAGSTSFEVLEESILPARG